MENIKNNTWIEEWDMPCIGYVVKEIDGIIEIYVDGMLVEFKNSIDFRNEGGIDYCIHIPCEHKVFNGYDLNSEEFEADDELLDNISVIRAKVEDEIESYLEKNDLLL